MATMNQVQPPLSIRGIEQAPSCPACGGMMRETDRVIENGSLYVWYDCPQAQCDEQWLDRRPAKAS